MKKKQFLLPLLMAIVMVAISPQKVWAWGGSGTSSSPYTISSAADLIKFANIVNGANGETRNVAAWGKLTADITLSGTWTAMGTDSNGQRYTGTFDGQGHTISGLNISSTGYNQGLFGIIDGATIKNFTLSGTVNASNDGVGSVVGRANGASQILDVKSSVNVNISGTRSKMGGIVGYLTGSSMVSGCTYTGTLDAGSSYDCIGGIVGFAEGGTFTGSITYCFCNGTLKTTSTNANLYIGGILGYLNDNPAKKPTIQYNFSDAKYKNGSSDISGKYINGIVGRIRNDATNVSNNHFVSTTKITNACNTDSEATISSTNSGITISVTAGSNGTVSQSYINPTSTAATQLQVVATPDAHYHLNEWSDNGAQTHNVGLTNNVDLSATFAIDQHTITVKANDGNMGTVDGGGTFDYNSTKTITATPKEHYHFVQWNDGVKTASRQITVTEDKTYTATFAIDRHTITVNVASGQGSMGTVSGGGIFDYNSKQTITATPKEHYHFVQWNDGVKTASRQITVTGDKTYTATFAIDQHTITVETNNSNYGTVSGGGTFDYNSKQTITATPKEHYHFVQWNDGVKTASRQITVTQDKAYTATFAIDQHTITVKTNDSNMGTVSGGGTYNYGTQQTITATPEAHYHFVQWSDGNTDASRQIMVNGNATYTATFAIDQHTITVQANNDDYGAVSGSGTFDYNSQQTITATPEEHYHFVQWNDGNTDASRPITVTDDAQQNTYTATFAIDQHTIALNVNNSNMGTVTGSGTFDYNSQQVITATPNTGCDFIGWSDGVKDATRQITVTDDAQQNTYTANFIQARAILTDGTLTFYYDGIDHDGTAYPLNTDSDRPGWHEKNSDITTVVFDASFASMRPTSCAFWFDKCENLSSITGIEYLNTEQVTTMESMFCRCVNLTSLDVSGFNTARVTDMESMFCRCVNLTSLDVSGFNTARVTDMGSMFNGCKKLTSLNLSSFNTANVENMSYMFSNCRELSELTIGNFDMQGVFGANRMFYDAETFLSLSALNTLTLKSLPFLADGTFNTQFTGLGKTVNVILDDNSVIYEGTNYLPTITNCNHYKHGGDDLVCTLCGQAAITHTGTCGTCTWTIYENGHMIIEPTEGETGTLSEWTKWNGSPWCAYRDEITSVKFRGEVIASTCLYMFEGCFNLTAIDFKGFKTTNVTNMDYMFQYCSSLQSLDLSSFNTANVNSMAAMFQSCSSLQSLDLSSFNTANVEYFFRMFSHCISLATLKLSNDFILSDGADKDFLFNEWGKREGNEDKLSIYYIIDENIQESLLNEFESNVRNKVDFVPSAIVKDGVPFNYSMGGRGCEIPAKDLVFTRTFTPGKPATITLPFTVTSDYVTNAKFYGFTSLEKNAETGKWEANMDRVRESIVMSYTPYMVLTEAESINFGNETQGVVFDQTPSELYNTTRGDWTFVATNEDKVWTDADYANGEVYYGYAKGDETTPEGKFVKVGAGAWIKPLRAYIMKNAQTPGGASYAPSRTASESNVPTTITVRLNEGATTGIGTLNTETGEFTFDGWYDLNGRRIEEPTESGIYINNGKKVLIK